MASQAGICHFRRLWTGMFDQHQAEITVMQFGGHLLPIHQFLTVLCDFNPVPYYQPSSPTQSLVRVEGQHHHHVALVARISLTLSRHTSLSFIALGRSSGQHPVSSHSCWMYFRAGRPAFVRPYVGVHKSTSLMSSSLLLQQCPACLVRLTWIVFVIGGSLAAQLVSCGVLLPGLVQDCTQHSCVIAV